MYVWAYNECGYSTPVLLTQQTTQFVCGSTLTFNYRGLTVNYGTVVGQNGTCWSSSSYVGSMNSPLKIPAAGLRNGADGTTFIYVGSRGYYWTSTTDGTNSRCLHISNNNAVVNTNGRTEGTSIRCVLEQ